VARSQITIPATTLFDLTLESVGHLFLLRTAIHPLRFFLVVIASYLKRRASIAYRTIFLAFLAPEAACPTSIEAPRFVVSIHA
jgi:hypothetical protein